MRLNEKRLPTWTASFFSYSKSLVDIELLLELVNSAAGIDHLLLAGEERMTLGAYVNTKLALCGLGRESFAASALYNCVAVGRMDSFSHDYTSVSCTILRTLISQRVLYHILSVFAIGKMRKM